MMETIRNIKPEKTVSLLPNFLAVSRSNGMAMKNGKRYSVDATAVAAEA